MCRRCLKTLFSNQCPLTLVYLPLHLPAPVPPLPSLLFEEYLKTQFKIMKMVNAFVSQQIESRLDIFTHAPRHNSPSSPHHNSPRQRKFTDSPPPDGVF